jgi:hypothetical protein
MPTWTPNEDAAVRAITADDLNEMKASSDTKFCTIPGLNKRTKAAVRDRLRKLSNKPGGRHLKQLLQAVSQKKKPLFEHSQQTRSGK